MANNTEATKKDTTPAPFVFPQFTFGATPATGNPFSLPGQTPLVFGSGVVATPAAAPETKDDEKDAEEAEREVNVHFEPVVKLTEVKVVTNEENEEAIFKMRAKLYRFDKGEWKERGLGDVRLMQDKFSHKIRILMRREKTLKICLNHYISPELELEDNSGSDKSWVWDCPLDYSQEPASHEVFAIRFGTAENAAKFKEAFNSARKTNADHTESKQEEKKEKTEKEEKKPE